MVIKILGMGCANCRKLYEMAEKAVKEAGIEAELIKVENIRDIMAYNVMRTPALVVNEKVKVSGRVPSYNEVLNFIKEEM